MRSANDEPRHRAPTRGRRGSDAPSRGWAAETPTYGPVQAVRVTSRSPRPLTTRRSTRVSPRSGPRCSQLRSTRVPGIADGHDLHGQGVDARRRGRLAGDVSMGRNSRSPGDDRLRRTGQDAAKVRPSRSTACSIASTSLSTEPSHRSRSAGPSNGTTPSSVIATTTGAVGTAARTSAGWSSRW